MILARFLSIFLLAVVLSGAAAAQSPEPASDEEIRLFDTVAWTNPAGDLITTSGTILEETPDQIVIKSRIGKFPIKKSSIQGEIRRRRPPDLVYKELVEKLRTARSDSERGDQYLKIGLFCARPNADLGGDLPMLDKAIGPERAFAHLYKAVQINPRNLKAYPYLLDLLALARESRGAREPKPSEIEEEADVYMLAKAGGFEHPEIDFRLAEILKDRLGRTDEAVKLYEKVLARAGGAAGPRNFSLERRARRSLAAIYRSRGEGDKALQIFTGGTEAGQDPKNPANFEAMWEAARIYVERGTPQDRARARDLFTKAQELQPDFPGIARYLAALDYADGKLGPAQARLLRLVDSGIPDPGLRVDLAIVEIQAGKFKQALKHLNAVLGDSPAGSADAPPASAPASPGAATPILSEEAGKAVPEDEKGEKTASPALAEKAAGSEKADVPAEEPGPPGPVDVELSRAHIARGQIFDARGNGTLARDEYRKALSLDPSSALAALLVAAADLRGGDPEGARATLDALIKKNASRRGVFSAYARVLADVEVAGGQSRKALNHLEYATGIDPGDPLLRRKIGTLLLILGEYDRSYQHLDAAQKVLTNDPALLNALAYYRYGRGEFEEAAKLFTKVRNGIPLAEAKEGKPTPPVPPVRRYAEAGLQSAQDAQRLEVWTDDFNRGSGEEVARNWREVESFGITVSVREDSLVFSGQQANDPTGVTLIVREEEVQNVERLSVRMRFDSQSGRVRAGIRIESAESRGGPPSAGLVFFRGYDGMLGFAKKTTRTGWEDGAPPAEKDQGKGKLIFPGDVKWPEGDGFHTLLIRKSLGSSQASSTFDLLLDGKPVAQNLVVEGLRGKVFQVGVSGQAEALGASYRFEADDFRLYRERQLRVRETQR